MRIFALTATILMFSSSAFAQSGQDWARFGIGVADAVIRGAQQGNYNNNYNNNHNHNNTQGRPKYYQAPAPNSSGASNQGNYGGGGFFDDDYGGGGYSKPQYQQPRYTPSYTQPSYSQPQYHNYTQPTYSQPAYSAPPVAPRVYSNLPIVIDCPSGLGGDCAYQLIEGTGIAYDYTISQGRQQNFTENSDWKIRYDQGNGLGYITYKLTGGKTYEFRRDDLGVLRCYAAAE
jgi:hypothetical protein